VRTLEPDARVLDYPVYILREPERSAYALALAPDASDAGHAAAEGAAAEGAAAGDAERTAPAFARREGLLFVGGFSHVPNADAMRWFLADILPLIHQERPDIRLHIVGGGAPEDILAAASERVICHGFVSDEALRRLYRTCRLAVVPLRFGAGIKGKVVEAMAQGLPVLTTPIGAEGFPDAEHHMAIADEAPAFARETLALYADEPALRDLAARATAFLERAYGAAHAEAVMRQALAGGRSGAMNRAPTMADAPGAATPDTAPQDAPPTAANIAAPERP